MRVVIIGGAGFIGINSAYYFLKQGCEVIIIDNLSRPGSDFNLSALKSKHKVKFIKADIRNYAKIKFALQSIGHIDSVLLLAAQVAVTTSVIAPREDFEINAMGTFNVLEALRENKQSPLLIFTSTNKVYGKLEHLEIEKKNNCYQYKNMPNGVDESTLLDFHSPYGCSKGAAEQYVRDYSRIYGLPTVVIRQSCIYGPNQFGIEDQGWVAWFSIAAMLDCQISIFGDGNQVRDVLYVEDAAKLYLAFMRNKEKCNGQIYNLGGGVDNQLSLNQLLNLLSNRFHKEITPMYKDWRPGDQKVYVSNIQKLKNELGWQPEVNVQQGVNQLIDWIGDHTDVLKKYVFKDIASVA